MGRLVMLIRAGICRGDGIGTLKEAERLVWRCSYLFLDSGRAVRMQVLACSGEAGYAEILRSELGGGDELLLPCNAREERSPKSEDADLSYHWPLNGQALGEGSQPRSIPQRRLPQFRNS